MGVAYHAWLAEMEYQANAPTASWYYWLGDYVMAGQVRRRFRETCWPWLLDGGCVGGFGDSLPRHGGADDEAAKGVEHQVSADAPMTIRNTDQRVDRPVFIKRVERRGENQPSVLTLSAPVSCTCEPPEWADPNCLACNARVADETEWVDAPCS